MLTKEQLIAAVGVLIEAHPVMDARLAELVCELLATEADAKVCSRVEDAFRVNGLFLDARERDILCRALRSRPLAVVPPNATCRARAGHFAQRSGRPESFAETSDPVTANLAALTEALDDPDADLSLLVDELGESCALAVASYLGLSITLIFGEVPVSFSVLEDCLDPGEILTSMMLPLSALGHRPSGSQLILYADTAGAFVDLAADITYALGARPNAVQIDEHLRLPDPALDAAGFTRLCRQNQAMGILLDRGHEPDEALTELHRLARFGAISIDVAARYLIDSTRVS